MWALPAEERLAEWKEFRTYIGCFPFDEAVTKVVNYWSLAPFVTNYLNMDGSNWPDPWNLVADGMYDNLAIALGMAYTLQLSNHGKGHTFDIVRLQDTVSFEEFNVVMVDDDKYVLNFTYNEVISKEQLGKNIVATHYLARLSHNQ